MMPRSEPTLSEFARYCNEHPSERFWQALRNWSGHNFVLVSPSKDDLRQARDTFYWYGRDAGRA